MAQHFLKLATKRLADIERDVPHLVVIYGQGEEVLWDMVTRDDHDQFWGSAGNMMDPHSKHVGNAYPLPSNLNKLLTSVHHEW